MNMQHSSLYRSRGRLYNPATISTEARAPQFFSHSEHVFCPARALSGGAQGTGDSMDKPQPITREGLQKIEEELRHLETVRRPEVAEKIKQAKELSSTQNNAEYEDAKNEQAMVEGRIQQLQALIQNAAIIDEDGAHKSKLVMLGSTVKVKSSEGGSHEYTIVGPAEADPRDGRISNESPVGRALIGKKVNEEVQVNVPKGLVTLKITKIS